MHSSCAQMCSSNNIYYISRVYYSISHESCWNKDMRTTNFGNSKQRSTPLYTLGVYKFFHKYDPNWQIVFAYFHLFLYTKSCMCDPLCLFQSVLNSRLLSTTHVNYFYYVINKKHSLAVIFNITSLINHLAPIIYICLTALFIII